MHSILKLILGVSICALIVAGVFYFFMGEDEGSSSSQEQEEQENEENEEEADGEEEEESQLAADEHLYKITFDALWSEDNGHTLIPDGPHFSPFVAWTHKEGVSVFNIAGTSTDGIKSMAETGGTELLVKELEELKVDGDVGEYVIGEKIDSPGSFSKDINVTQKHRYVTVVSMLAPSPDWFVAIRDVRLFSNNEWEAGTDNVKTEIYDAGTDSGLTFTGEDKETDPREGIYYLIEDEIDLEEGGGSIARISVKRVDEN